MTNGAELERAILPGINHIVRNKALVSGLNIFPAPGGDTGTNIPMTILTAARELEESDGVPGTGAVVRTVASAMLRGTHGNSGVILSLLLRGSSKGLEGLEQATGADLCKALGLGVDAAYKAAMEPTEGTILTVSRVAFEKGQAAVELDDDAASVWSAICKGVNEALETTSELLPVLKKASVVDAGGKGLCLIFEGMLSAFQDDVISDSEQNASSTGTGAMGVQSAVEEFHRNVTAGFDQEITFTYYIEFIVGRDPEIEADPQTDSRLSLEGIGDCVAVVDDEEIIKVYVHTENPGNVLQKALEYGQLLTVKARNMEEQHRVAAENNQATPAPAVEHPVTLEIAESEEEIGFAAVAAGDGLCSLFMNLDCSQVVNGGQIMNPSTQDIMAAVLAIPIETVMMLSNNKNIVMAAEQTTPLAKDRRVVILPTRTIPQGLSTMLVYDPEVSVERSTAIMMEAAGSAATGQVTFVVHDSEFDGHRIREGDTLGLKNGKLDMIEKDPARTVVKLARSMISRTTLFITLIYDKDITESQAQDAYNHIKSKIGDDVEVMLVDGGQPVYHSIVSVE